MLVAVLIGTGCNSGQVAFEQPGQDAAPVIGARSQSPAIPGREAVLPAPGKLEDLLPEPRGTSYVPGDLVKQADEYGTSMPNNRVMPVPGGPVEFDPAWSSSINGPDLLAYCMYAFSIPGYDLNDQIRYHFGTQPAPGDGWIGLADWGPDIWNWYELDGTGVLELASLDPYIGFGGNLLLCVVVMGTDNPVLDWVRVGTLPPVADYTFTPDYAFAPQVVSFDASASSDADGSIVRYEWDMDGDGSFEIDRADDPLTDYEFTAKGAYNVGLRVTDNDNAAIQTTNVVSVAGNVRHTWGKENDDCAMGCDVDSAGNLYISGYTYNGSVFSGAVLAKYDFLGQPVWAKLSDGNNEESLGAVVVGDDGSIYTCGRTSSSGAGGHDGLVQKWTGDGDLIWCKTWGGSELEIFESLAFSSGDIFIAGSSDSFTHGERDAVFLRVSSEGELVWDKHYGSTDWDEAHAIVYSRLMISDPVLRVTGTTRINAGSSLDVMYVSFGEDGTFYTREAFSAANDQRGLAIAAAPPMGGTTVITGYHDTGTGVDTLVMAAGGSWARTRHWEERSKGQAVIRTGDDYLIGGMAYNVAGTITDMFLLKVSSEGVALGFETRDYQTEDDDIVGLAPFLSGAALVGNSVAADATWAEQLYSVSHLAGSWYSLLYVPTEIDSTALEDVALTVSDITGAVIDSGGGGEDIFFELREL